MLPGRAHADLDSPTTCVWRKIPLDAACGVGSRTLPYLGPFSVFLVFVTVSALTRRTFSNRQQLHSDLLSRPPKRSPVTRHLQLMSCDQARPNKTLGSAPCIELSQARIPGHPHSAHPSTPLIAPSRSLIPSIIVEPQGQRDRAGRQPSIRLP
jgi:hypothetical protein